MATYAIGDIQGCYKTLKKLLKRIAFDDKEDRLFLVGDLVNRGPDSLDVLRWAYDLRERIVTVLGNHDVHLLAFHAGVVDGRYKKYLGPVIRAKDAPEMLEWLREQPFLYREGRIVLVHAGILPIWTVDEAFKLAKKAAKELQSKRYVDFLRYFYKIKADIWREDADEDERLSVAVNAFTRMRMCRSASEMDMSFNGQPQDAPAGLVAWYNFPHRKSEDHTIIFGHWAALGLRVTNNVIALDSGCVWGGQLSALRLEDGAIFSEPSAE